MKLKEIAAIIAAMGAANCPATTYYVSPAGNDNLAGTTIATAWKTTARANSSNYKPGDTLLFEGGKTFNGNISWDQNDANDPMNIAVISSYGTGRAIIKTAGATYGFSAYNTQGFSISNLIFEGPGISTGADDGLAVFTDLPAGIKLKNIIIKNIEVRFFGKCGIALGSWNSGNSGYQNVLIESVHVHHVKENGINVYGYFSSSHTGWANQNISIKNTLVHDVPGYKSNSHKGSGIIMGGVEGGLIESCVAHHNGLGNTQCGGPGGIWTYESTNIVIQYCESYNNSAGSGCDGLGFDLDGGVTNSILQYNYSHDNDGAGILLGQFQDARPWGNNIIRYNISENDGRVNLGSICFFKGPGSVLNGAKVYHNTIYVTHTSANPTAGAFTFLQWNTGISNVEVYNNIFQTTGGTPLVFIPAGYSAYFAGNLYWPTGANFKIDYQGTAYGNLNSWRSATGNEKVNSLQTGITADPLFNSSGNAGTVYPKATFQLNSYRQTNNSPAVDAGLNLPTLFGINPGSHDFFNNPSPALNPDIGAFESPVATSASGENEDSALVIFPNPVKWPDEVTIRNISSFEVLDLEGKILLKKNNSGMVTTRNLSRGVYLIRAVDDGGYQHCLRLVVE